MSSTIKKPDQNPSFVQVEKWQVTCSELRSAFHSWEKIQTLGNAMSPDEKKLQEFKSLIKEIRDQIQEFEN
jgi:hypothetical protein